jgi:cytochrome b561
VKQKSFSNTTIVLHWIVGIAVMLLLASGPFLKYTKGDTWFDAHELLAFLIFPFVFIRIWWRYREGMLPRLPEHREWEHRLASIVQLVFLISLPIMLFSGIAASVAKGYGFGFYGFNLLAPNVGAKGITPLSPLIAQFASWTHWLIGIVLIIGVTLHIIGALNHHFVKHGKALLKMTRLN